MTSTLDSEYGAPSDARAQSNVQYHPQPAAKQPIQQPVQQVQYVTHAPTFVTAFPLHALNQGPAPVDCPVCHRRAMTTIEFEAGSSTQFIPSSF